MFNLIGFPFNLTGLLGSVALTAVLAGTGSGVLVHKLDAAKYLRLEAKQQAAQVEAVVIATAKQRKIDQSNQYLAVAEVEAQQRIITVTHTIKERVPYYVKEITPCVPYGFVRVLNAAAFGTDPDSEPTTTGKSPDACAPVSWRSLVTDITDDYGTGNQNAEQLNSLIGSVTANDAAAN